MELRQLWYTLQRVFNSGKCTEILFWANRLSNTHVVDVRLYLRTFLGDVSDSVRLANELEALVVRMCPNFIRLLDEKQIAAVSEWSTDHSENSPVIFIMSNNNIGLNNILALPIDRQSRGFSFLNHCRTKCECHPPCRALPTQLSIGNIGSVWSWEHATI